MGALFDDRRLAISTLSPVHMGTGEDYEPGNYVIDGDTLYEFDSASAAAAIGGEQRRQLGAALMGRPDEKMLKSVQRFFHDNRERVIPGATNALPVKPSVAALYAARIGVAASVERDGKQVINQLHIERTCHDFVTRAPMMPGSGLKGAIRTALLDGVNDGHSLRPRERHRELQQRLFEYTMRDLHLDPMRLVRLADAPWRRNGALNGCEVCFAVNRKKDPVYSNGVLVASRAEQQNLYQLLECVPAFRMRAFEGRLTIANVAAAGADAALPAARLRFGCAAVAAACNRFYRPILDRELRLFEERGYADPGWMAALRGVLDTVAPRLERNEAFLLRVGRHSGAESVTLNGVRSIKIMKGKGGSPENLSHSKTWWFVADELQDRRHLRPFGWVLVEIARAGEALPEWPAADSLTVSMVRAAGDWRRAVDERRADLTERLTRERDEERRRDLQDRKRREAEATRAEQERERLARELEGLPEDTSELVRLARAQRWISDNNALLDGLDGFLDAHPEPSPQALDKVTEFLDRAWPGILVDPDATRGKRAKPRFRERPRGLAKRLLALRES